MIEIYTGFVGSGKSFHAVKRGVQVADAPFGDGWVVANFPIKPKKSFLSRLPIIGRFVKSKELKSRWIFKENDEMTVDYLVNKSVDMGWYGKENSALLLVDEAGILFNSRDWNVKPDERKKWIKFLSQSRKFGYNVVFIAQDARMIDRQIRSLAEYEVQHKKMNSYSIFRFLPFTFFACISFWNGARNVRGGASFCVYTKAVADRYDTMGLFDFGKDELEGLIEKS
ncbi:zonular occludens toxin domain-containing protein [Bacillus thuringiensis]|uniref:zonular occludens toxin domain-containing protein n=1 Tax=Bacillus thuringiensis TaxID=1428 RepID=UPI00382827E6